MIIIDDDFRIETYPRSTGSMAMSMRARSKAMGRTVKNLEDIETVQPYGCHITLDILLATSNAYGWTLAELVEWESPEGGTE